ncbi:hypothetical protein LSM04_000056 [Trypanosoma melophagium]|uniref:uncharacterized protein n=1 Tax=Trypanosoma melophagium TaxID=715481 RepID=UPI00351A6D84|nr:hypothetical protein LSM04_000056 [Trypanosoma melophagium]
MTSSVENENENVRECRSDAGSVVLEGREEPRTVLNTPKTVSGDEIVRQRISPYEGHTEESCNSLKSNKLRLIEDDGTTSPNSPLNNSRCLLQVSKTSKQLKNIFLGNVTYVHFTSDAIDTQRSHNVNIPDTLSRERDVQNYNEEKQDQGDDANPVNVKSIPWSKNSKKCKTKYLKRHSDMAQASVLLSEISQSRGNTKSSFFIRKLASCTEQEASQFFSTTCSGYIFCNDETEDCFREFLYMGIRRMLPFMAITIGVVFILTLVLSTNHTHTWSGCLLLVTGIGELVIGTISTILFPCGYMSGKGINNQTLKKGH